MVGMRAVFRVVMHFHIGKRVGLITLATISAMDMKGKYGRGTNPCGRRQSVYFGGKDSTDACLIKIHNTAYLGIIVVPVYIGNCIGRFTKYGF